MYKGWSLLLRHVFLASQFNAWNVNKVSPFELGWNVIFQHWVTQPLASSLHPRLSQPPASGLAESRPAQMQSKEHWGTSSDEHLVPQLCAAPSFPVSTLQVSAGPAAPRSSLCLLSATGPMCSTWIPTVCAVVWKLPQAPDQAKQGVHCVCSPSLRILHTAFTQVFHILNQFYTCFQQEDKSSIHYPIMTRSKSLHIF